VKLVVANYFYLCFDLWMFKGEHDIMFTLVIIIFANDWLGKHITIGLFETIELLHNP
jgi:hypothetical protein